MGGEGRGERDGERGMGEEGWGERDGRRDRRRGMGGEGKGEEEKGRRRGEGRRGGEDGKVGVVNVGSTINSSCQFYFLWVKSHDVTVQSDLLGHVL